MEYFARVAEEITRRFYAAWGQREEPSRPKWLT